MKEKCLTTKTKLKADYYIPDEEDKWEKGGDGNKRRTYDHMDDDDYDDDGKDYDDQ